MDIVRQATKGIGTKEDMLINTLCNRTKKQLDAIDLRYHKKVRAPSLFRSPDRPCFCLLAGGWGRWKGGGWRWGGAVYSLSCMAVVV